MSVLNSFENPALGRARWEELVARSAFPSVTLSWEWQRAWWETYGGSDDLLLVLARDRGEPSALAALYATEEMLFFVGSGGSDYLDVIGARQSAAGLAKMLAAAAPAGPTGFRLYHVPEGSPTAASIQRAASRLGMDCYEEDRMATPTLDLRDTGQLARALDKRTVARKQRRLERAGALSVHHEREAEGALGVLEEFFAMHRRRWRARGEPSQFEYPAHRRFVARLCERGGEAGWLCLSHLDMEERPIAFELGSLYRSRYLAYLTAFDLEFARDSPGNVLLRHVIAYAARAGAATFDFGLGDERYKEWYASAVGHVITFGLYS